jgi:hypothetical protein
MYEGQPNPYNVPSNNPIAPFGSEQYPSGKGWRPRVVPAGRDNDGNPLSKQQLRQLNKKKKSTVNKTNNIKIIDINSMNDRIANNEAQLNLQNENINNQTTDLGLFIPT